MLRRLPKNQLASSTATHHRRHYIKGSNSAAWLSRQRHDLYRREAVRTNYRARSAFKLTHIDDRHSLFRSSQVVIDLGAAPGSWSQVAAQRVEPSRRHARIISKMLYNDETFSSDDADAALLPPECGLVIGVDLQAIEPIGGCVFLDECDFQESGRHRLESLLRAIGASRIGVDVVMSDMAPNASGHGSMDHERIMALNYAACRFALANLREGGSFLCKMWSGGMEMRFVEELGERFRQVTRVRPPASRAESAELFVLAKGLLVGKGK